VTLPPEIREALHVHSGDEIEFAVDEQGRVTVRGFVSIPADQAWFFTPEWQAGEREAEAQKKRGEGDTYDTDEEFLASFESD
jgi:antitoxin PrlF